jgi:uncharacterized membrane protein YhaH (DUF805 family)
MDWVWYLFGFKGRINRAKMWLALLIIMCWMIFLGGLTLVIGGLTSFRFGIDDIFAVLDPATWHSLSPADLGFGIVRTIESGLFLWVYLATSIKRLHDRDKSGWWMVPFFAVPGIDSRFADRIGEYWMLAMPFALMAFVFCIWGFVEMYCRKGSRKTNRFGPNPLLPVDTRPRWEQAREVEMVPRKASPPPVWHVKRSA